MPRQDFLERQVQTLKRLVERWHASGGADVILQARVRDAVAMDLLCLPRPEVVVRVLGELDVLEADRLQDMIDLCSQTFYRNGETWNAFAVPVAVQWHMQPHRIFIAKRAQPHCMTELAAGIRQCLGAEKVVLDGAIYSANALYGLSAYALHDHLQVLANGTPRFTRGPQRMTLQSSSEPPWRMVYFLGVEITKPGGKRQFQDPGVQAALQPYLHWGADALTEGTPAESTTAARPTKFEMGAHGQTICHAPRYLFDAIQFGEKALRSYHLRQIVEEVTKEEMAITLFHRFDPASFSINLLIKGRWLAFEMQWKLFVAETPEDALMDIHAVVEQCAPPEKCQFAEVDFEGFRIQRRKTALGVCSIRRFKNRRA